MRPRLSLAILLALLLVFAQQAGAVHALSHFSAQSEDRDGKHLPGGKACEQCVAFASIDGAAKSESPLVLPVASRQHFSKAVTRSAVAAVTTAHYQSRAPPAFL